MSLDRCSFLSTAMFGDACCLAARAVGAAEPSHAAGSAAHAAPHWSYAGNTGPDHWGALQPDFKVCQLGLEQTPIDLAGGMRGDATPVMLDYKPLPLRILNNGHTIQVNADAGSSCTVGGEKYELLQFHFHHPSEHLLAGKPFDLECHFVHRSGAGNLAVVGVFIVPGSRNAVLQKPIEASAEQIRQFAALFPNNARPVQGRHRRFLIESN